MRRNARLGTHQSAAVARQANGPWLGRMECFDFEAVRDFFYHDCDEPTARWAFAQLSPAPTEFLVEPVSLPRFWKADLPRSYIRCLQDRAKPLSSSEKVVRRLGVSPLAIDASHSPFLSRPAELAELFVHATTTRPLGPLDCADRKCNADR